MFIIIKFPLRTTFAASCKVWYAVFPFSFVVLVFLLISTLVVLVPASLFSFLLFRLSSLSCQIQGNGLFSSRLEGRETFISFVYGDTLLCCPQGFWLALGFREIMGWLLLSWLVLRSRSWSAEPVV